MAVPAQRATALDCAPQRRLCVSAVCLSSVLVLVGFLFEVIQFVENCLCWIAFSAALTSVAELTLGSIGYMAELAGKAVLWCCIGAGSGRAPVSD